MPHPLTVLLVEDNTTLRIASAQALQLAGIEVKSFSAAELVRATIHPDFRGVLVTAVRLRGMDRLTLLQHPVNTDAKRPVILSTGHGDISMPVHAMRMGADDFIR